MTARSGPHRALAVAATLAAVLATAACGSGAETTGADAPSGAAVSTTPAPSDAVPPAPGVVATPAASAPSEPPEPVDLPATVRSPAASAGSAAGSAPGSSPGSGAAPGNARAVLATLAVKGRAAGTGYDRDVYGQAWADVDRNGCDTRNDILRRDLVDEVFKPGTNNCVVLSGVLDPEPYTGKRIEFVRGEVTSMAVQIDHVVALKDSWVSGAFAWDERKRIAFANDPLNLLAVDGPANAQKSDGDAATWLPRASYRCTFVARQIAVKAKYELWVKPAERDAMSRILDTCPDQSVPAYGPVELPPPGLGSAAPAQPVATPKPAGGGSGGGSGSGNGGGANAATDPRFPYCTDAKRAGYGPYVRGEDPEYDWYRDGDSDGIVCE